MLVPRTPYPVFLMAQQLPKHPQIWVSTKEWLWQLWPSLQVDQTAVIGDAWETGSAMSARAKL